MTKRLLGKEELEDIVWGSTILGAGGGGSPHDGLTLVQQIKNEVVVFDVEDLPENANAVVVAAIGSPKVMIERGFGPEAVFAYEAIKNMAAVGGINLAYLMPGEIGGLNTITPLYVAAQKIYQIPTSPLVVANKAGDIIVAYLKDPLDTTAAETIARTAAVSFGMLAAFATWIVNMGTIKKYLVPDSISKSEEIGRAIRKSKASRMDAVREVTRIAGGTEVFRGKIKRIETKTVEGFDFARTTIEGMANYRGKTFNIDSKNENMIGWQDGKAIIMVPDLISVMTTEGEPLTNADTKEGMEIAVIGIPAPEPWKRIPEGFNCWKPILEKLGYEGPYITLKKEV